MKKFLKVVILFLFLASFSISLTSCEGKGKIVIKEPQGATVYINGKKVGKVPIELELREGKYNITVETDPFISETKKNVQVYFDKTITLSFNPTPKGILEVDSLPQHAEVWDGRNFLGYTPLKEKLDPGFHDILLYKGNLSAERKINIEYKKTTKLFVNLEKAVVYLSADPSDATIKIGNKTITKFPATLELDEGTYKVVVMKGPYVDEFTLSVRKGDEINLSYTLQPVQLPPVQAYGPVRFTHNQKYLVSMGKAGIYFWNINKFKPEISLYDPQDVRNFDKFINFNISENDEYVVGIKPIRKLAYALSTKQKTDKILVWDLKTLSVKFSHLYTVESKYPFFLSSDKILLIEKNGKIHTVDLKTADINNVSDLKEPVTAAKKLSDIIIIGTKGGNLYKYDINSNTLDKVASLNNEINDIAFSHNKDKIYIASDKIYVMDKEFKNIDTIDIDKTPIAVAVSPSDSKLAVSYGDTVKVYSTNDKSTIYEIKNLPASIISLLFKDDEILITASGIESPYIGIWKNGNLLKKWVQSIQ
jgi:hypothetical protein